MYILKKTNQKLNVQTKKFDLWDGTVKVAVSGIVWSAKLHELEID